MTCGVVATRAATTPQIILFYIWVSVHHTLIYIKKTQLNDR